MTSEYVTTDSGGSKVEVGWPWGIAALPSSPIVRMVLFVVVFYSSPSLHIYLYIHISYVYNILYIYIYIYIYIIRIRIIYI